MVSAGVAGRDKGAPVSPCTQPGVSVGMSTPEEAVLVIVAQAQENLVNARQSRARRNGSTSTA